MKQLSDQATIIIDVSVSVIQCYVCRLGCALEWSFESQNSTIHMLTVEQLYYRTLWQSVGLEEFLVDSAKASYSKLGFKRDSLMKILPSAFSKKWRDASTKAKSLNLGGNMTQGDGYQKGGCLVVGAGGTPTMFTYIQQDAADHPDNADILESLGIQQAASDI